MKQFFRPLIIASLGLVAAGLSSCSSVKKSSSGMYGQDFDPPAKRPGNIANVRIKVSTGAQRVYVVEGSKVLLATPCSVGSGGLTGSGNYTIQYKDANHRRQSEPDRGYPMFYWQEWKSAYGLHWGYVKPYPCTHGCIRLPMKSAAKIFQMTRVGTPINIAASQPEDETVGKTLPVINDGPLPDPPKSYLLSQKFWQDSQPKGNLFSN